MTNETNPGTVERNAGDVIHKARAIAAAHWRKFDSISHRTYADEIEAGKHDECEAVSVAIAALSTLPHKEEATPAPVGEQGADKPCGTCGGYGLARGGLCWNCSGSGKEPAPPSQDEGLSIEDVHLVALLRREGTYNNVWFADRLLDAANLIERLATPQPQDEGVRDTLAALANRYRDTMGLTREGAIRRIGVLVDAILGSTPATTTTERGRG